MREFVSLIMQYQRLIHAYILYQVPNSYDAEDILQETLTEMFKKFEAKGEVDNFLAWGLTIARFKIMGFFRDKRREKMVFDSSLVELLEHESQTHAESFIQEREALKTCMKKLSNREKRLLELRHVRDQSYRRIAAQFNVSMQAIYKSVSRIHARLFRCVSLSLAGRAV